MPENEGEPNEAQPNEPEVEGKTMRRLLTCPKCGNMWYGPVSNSSYHSHVRTCDRCQHMFTAP